MKWLEGRKRELDFLSSTYSYMDSYTTEGTCIHVCYAQSMDSDHSWILLRKPQILSLRNSPTCRIAHAKLGLIFELSVDLLCKPRILSCTQPTILRRL